MDNRFTRADLVRICDLVSFMLDDAIAEDPVDFDSRDLTALRDRARAQLQSLTD